MERLQLEDGGGEYPVFFVDGQFGEYRTGSVATAKTNQGVTSCDS